MPKLCAHLGYLFTELPLGERFGAAREAGFQAIEHPAPYGFGIAEFRTHARQAGLAVAQIAAPAGDAALGEKGLACLPGRGTDFRQSVDRGIEAAQRLECPNLHIMPGILPAGTDRDALRRLYTENLAWAGDRCARAGLQALIEPISDETVPGFYMNHPDFAVSVLQELAHASVGLLFDIYHAAVKRLDPVVFLERHIGLVRHIQIADFPGRHEPGTGGIDFQKIFEWLDASAYPGWVGCEYKPAGATRDGLHWMPEKTDRSGPRLQGG